MDINKDQSSELHHQKQKKRNILVVLGVCLLAGVFFLAFMNFPQKKSISLPPDRVIAKVGNEEIYQSYITREEELYSGKITPETKKKLLDKVIYDSIILQSAYKEGLMPNAFGNKNPTKEKYLERKEQVRRIEAYIKNQSDGIMVQTVSIRFYEDGYIGPKGLDESKKIANEKITSIYQKVRSKQVPIEKVGQLIAEDTSLREIYPSYRTNAVGVVYAANDENLTQWPQFDELARKTKVGDVTPIYLGKVNYKGKMVDAVYMFGYIMENKQNGKYNSFSDWYSTYKKEYKIVYKTNSK